MEKRLILNIELFSIIRNEIMACYYIQGAKKLTIYKLRLMCNIHELPVIPKGVNLEDNAYSLK